MAKLWQRLKARIIRSWLESLEVQAQLARENPRPILSLFPHRPDTIVEIVVSVIVGSAIAGVLWYAMTGRWR